VILDDKKQIVEDLSERFARSAVVIVTDYKGLDVTTLNGLRRQLREVGTEYRVVKNTLLIRASKDNDVNLIKDAFKGPNAIAFSYDDPVAPAKVLTQFAKENDKLEIKAGVMGGKVLDLDAIKALSALPSREQLLAQVLSTMMAVPTSLVRALNDVPQRMVNVLVAVKDQKASAEA
jgi:large subunit ribosomal protein L10